MIDHSQYNFPVELQPIYSKDGDEIPGTQAVVRTDVKRPLCAVSSSYALLPHAEMLDATASYMRAFGESEMSINASADGIYMYAIFDFKARSMPMRVGDMVSLRLVAGNSYNGKSSASLNLSAEVLSCLNMVCASRGLFSHYIRHIGSLDLNFPEPDKVLETWELAGRRWDNMGALALPEFASSVILDDAELKNVVPASHTRAARDGIASRDKSSAWDLHQDLTHYVTHVSRIEYANRMKRLAKITDHFGEFFDLDDGRIIVDWGEERKRIDEETQKKLEEKHERSKTNA